MLLGVRWVLTSLSRPGSLRALRLNLDIDPNGLANAGNCLSRLREHQVEVAPVDWVGRHRPARAICFIHWRYQFHVKRNRPCHTVHRQVAGDVAALGPGPLHAAALKGDLRNSFRVEEFCAAQMIVTFFDPCVDAAHVDLCRD